MKRTKPERKRLTLGTLVRELMPVMGCLLWVVLELVSVAWAWEGLKVLFQR